MMNGLFAEWEEYEERYSVSRDYRIPDLVHH